MNPPHHPGLSPYSICVLVLMGCGLLGAIRSWWGPRPTVFPARLGLLLDAGVVAFLSWLMFHHLLHLHALQDPHWFPVGQDHLDYLSSTLWMLDADAVPFCAFRYPLYPWLSAWASRLQGLSPAVGAMQISLLASMLLPGALYVLGRQLAPRAVAASAGLLVVHQPDLLQSLGTPYEYILCTLLFTLALASGVWALARGGLLRYLVFGILSALVMASTAKSLAFLLPALGFVLLSVAWQLKQRTWMALGWLGAWALPLAVMWGIFASHKPYFHTLEYLIFNVQAGDHFAQTGTRSSAPAGVGWKETDPAAQQGYWRVGEAQALWHLPQTLRFLATGAQPTLPMSLRWQAFGETFKGTVAIPDLRWLLPGLLGLGLLGTWPRGRPYRLSSRILAAGLLTASVGLQLGGALGTLPQYRYLQQLAVLAPLLVLAGLTGPWRLICRPGVRQLEAIWSPVFLVTLYVTSFHPGPFGLEARKVPSRDRLVHPPMNDIMKLKSMIKSGDGVADLTQLRLAHYTFYNTSTPVVSAHFSGPDQSLGAVSPGTSWTRRWLVHDCDVDGEPGLASRLTYLSAAFAADPERYLRYTPCLLLDRQPWEPLSLLPPGMPGPQPLESSREPAGTAADPLPATQPGPPANEGGPR